jgi:glycosyltransferase involved in cell wall biosynthesis
VDHEHYQLVCHERNQGIGAALRTGFRTASKHIVVTVDADTNYDVRDVPLLLEYFNSGADLVTGSIFAPGAEWNYPAHRFVLSRSLVELYRRALKGKGDNIYTFTCGFRAYEREKLLECLPEADDFVATAEILIRFLLKGFSVVEYPCFNYDRKYGVSKLRTLSTIKSHLEFMKKVYLGQVG